MIKIFKTYKVTIVFALLSFFALLVAIGFSYYFIDSLAKENGQFAAWVQAVGSVVAIVIAIILAFFQRDQARDVVRQHEHDGAKATCELARESLAMVGDRLSAALQPPKPRSSHALRGFRTTEMVAAMRDLEASKIPSELIVDFVSIRTGVFAINARINELYDREKNKEQHIASRASAQRNAKLHSAVQVYRQCKNSMTNMASIAKEKFDVNVGQICNYQPIDNYCLSGSVD